MYMNVIEAPTRVFQLLGDAVRWRLLRLLTRAPLNVSEATAIVGVAQSGVSRHLRLLQEGGLVREERRGGWSFFALAAEPPLGLAGLWAPLREGLSASSDAHGDDARLAEVLRERAERGEGEGGLGRAALEPGRSWAAWSQALALLLPPSDVVQLGCGSGALTLEVARWANELLAVEPDEALAAQARARLAASPRVRVVTAPLSAVPAPDAAFDLVLVAQALSAAADPGAVAREAFRLAKPGQRVLVLDLLPHRERWVLERFGHRRLGFTPDELAEVLLEAGFEIGTVAAAERRRGNPFVVLMAAARKPEAQRLRPAREAT